MLVLNEMCRMKIQIFETLDILRTRRYLTCLRRFSVSFFDRSVGNYAFLGRKFNAKLGRYGSIYFCGFEPEIVWCYVSRFFGYELVLVIQSQHCIFV